MECTTNPYRGVYEPQTLQQLFYGADIVREKLLTCSRNPTKKAFIITGNSLATKTPLIALVEDILTPARHAGTFHDISQHATSAPLLTALEKVEGDDDIDTIITIGGGSPIDSGKTIIYQIHQNKSRWLHHIAIPTTLSAAECTNVAGTTQPDGLKQAVRHPRLPPTTIFYDPAFALHTPLWLFMSTGIRALDHAVELQVNRHASWFPCQMTALGAIRELFTLLPKFKQDPTNEDIVIRLFLASFASLGFFGQNMRGSVGLSHTIGYSLGSPYGIPHGVTSCMTLAKAIRLIANNDPHDAERLAAILPYMGRAASSDVLEDCNSVAQEIENLVRDLGLDTTLTAWKVDRDQVDLICARAVGSWMPGEVVTERRLDFQAELRVLVQSLY